MAALCRKHFIDVDQVFRVGDVDVEYGREQLEGVLIWVARNRPEPGDRFQAHLIRYLGIDDIDLDLWLMQAEEREKEAVTSNARDNL